MKNWKKITDKSQVDQIIEDSENETQIIFKDSVSCGISAFAKERVINGTAEIEKKACFNYLDLLAHRDVSNYIAETLGVIHQSPQIIVVKNKKATYSVTHHTITPEIILKNI